MFAARSVASAAARRAITAQISRVGVSSVRMASTAHAEHKSSDLLWQVGSLAFFVPAIGWCYTNTVDPSKAHHGHGDSHAEHKEQKSTPPPAEKKEPVEEKKEEEKPVEKKEEPPVQEEKKEEPPKEEESKTATTEEAPLEEPSHDELLKSVEKALKADAPQAAAVEEAATSSSA